MSITIYNKKRTKNALKAKRSCVFMNYKLIYVQSLSFASLISYKIADSWAVEIRSITMQS